MKLFKEFVLSTLGIFFCFLAHGIYVEYNAEHRYDGKKFKFSTFYIIFQSLLMIAFTVILKVLNKEKFEIKKLLRRDLVFAGIFQTLAIFSTLQMTFKVDYLFNVLFRSSKFLSVLFGSLIFKSDGHENISYSDLSWGLVLTFGVFVFNLGSDSKKSMIYSIEGFLFGFFSLICDSFVSHFQLSSKKKQKLTYLDFTLAMNIFIFFSNIILSLLTRELEESFSFVLKHPSVIWHILP